MSTEAPGRVDLLGEHTDYNDGYVLPTAIPQTTSVSLRENGGKQFSVYAAQAQQQAAKFTMESAPHEHFASYVYGCLRELRDHSFEAPHFRHLHLIPGSHPGRFIVKRRARSRYPARIAPAV